MKTPTKGKRVRQPKRTTQEIIDAVKKTDGRLTFAAKLLGVAYSTMMNYIKRPGVAEAIKEAQENELDFAEHQLKKNINRGDQRAVEFLLKTKGKHRGYVERKEVRIDIDKLKDMPDEELEALARGGSDDS